MSTKICISKKLLILLLTSLFIATVAVFLSNYLLRRPTTVKTRAEVTDEKNYIKFGVEAEANEFPYFALISSSQGMCGGALISEDWVLTAAHCVLNEKKENVQIIIGLNRNDAHLLAQHSSPVSEIIVHDFISPSGPSTSSITNDIALLKLAKSAKGVPYVSIPNPNFFNKQFTSLNQGVMVGFGLDESNRLPKELRKGSVYNASQLDISNAKIRMPPLAQDKLILLPTQKAIMCGGDSGGPFVMTVNNKPQLIGVAKGSADSSTENCIVFSVFTSVPYFSKWISEHTKIEFESGVDYLTPDHRSFYPPQVSHKSYCSDNINRGSCEKVSIICRWYSGDKCTNRCTPSGASETDICK